MKKVVVKNKKTSKKMESKVGLERGGGTQWRSWLKHCATSRKVAGSIPYFLLTQSFRSHYGFGVDSASNRNEYQEYFLGVKTAGA